MNHVLKYNFVTSRAIEIKNCFLRASIGGSVVECSPATRAARVRFPADATFLWVAGLTFPLKQTYVTRTLREP